MILLTDWDTSKPLSNKFGPPPPPQKKRKHSQALTVWDLMTRLIDLLLRQVSRKQKGLEIKPYRFQSINWNQAMNWATLINWGRSQALVLSQKPLQWHFNRFSSNEPIFAWSNLCTQYFNLGSLHFHTFIHINELSLSYSWCNFASNVTPPNNLLLNSYFKNLTIELHALYVLNRNANFMEIKSYLSFDP